MSKIRYVEKHVRSSLLFPRPHGPLDLFLPNKNVGEKVKRHRKKNILLRHGPNISKKKNFTIKEKVSAANPTRHVKTTSTLSS